MMIRMDKKCIGSSIKAAGKNHKMLNGKSKRRQIDGEKGKQTNKFTNNTHNAEK